jgi:hypothetical protein
VKPEPAASEQPGPRVRRRRKPLGSWRPPSFADIFRKAPFNAAGERPDDMPSPDRGRDREIEDALEVLKSVPFEELQRRGWHFQPNHYYWPLNDVSFLRRHPEVWVRRSVPAEIDWDIEGQIALLRQIAPHFSELSDVPDGPPLRPGEFVWGNDAFPRGDACTYYGILRRLGPRRVIEVGAGWSTLVMARAVAKNEQPCEVTLIDPEPGREALGALPSDWTLLEDPVQLVDTAVFEALEAGDVLFYDGSHCVKTGSDVNWIFFEVLPRLAPGVWIHVHDLGWPWDYPVQWVLDEGLSWNEQYFVQAFLMNNHAYRVRLAVAMLWAERQREVTALVGEPLLGGSLWIEKTGTG